MGRFAFVVFVIVAGCQNTKGFAQTVAGLPPDTVFAWDFHVEGGVAHWRECASVDTCGLRERELRASDVIAVENAGKATVQGGQTVTVVKLSVTPGPRYVPPRQMEMPFQEPTGLAGRR